MAGEANLSPDRRFQELCAHIGTTDEISFKLLGLVPLVSGAGIAAVFLKAEVQPSALIYLLSLFAAIVTVALFCWERRNIQICKWLRDQAANLEAESLGKAVPAGHFVNFPRSPLRLGKTEAEKVVYAVRIAAWLLLPWILRVSSAPALASNASTAWLREAHIPLAWSIGAVTVVLVVMPIRTTATNRADQRKDIQGLTAS